MPIYLHNFDRRTADPAANRRVERCRTQVHVALGHRQIRMPGEFLNRPRRRASHREVRTERVTQDVHPVALTFARRAARLHPACTICRVNGVPSSWHSTRVLRRCRCSRERRRQPSRERHVSQPPTLRRSSPVRSSPTARRTVAASRDRHRPTRARSSRRTATRPHRPAARSGASARSRPARRRPAVRTRSKSWNAAAPFGTGSSLILHGIRSITSHSTAFFSSMLSTASTLLTVFGDLISQLRFQPLHVLARDRVEMFSTRTPGSGATRRIRSFAAIPLGFCRFARAWPSTKRGANSCRVGTSLRV